MDFVESTLSKCGIHKIFMDSMFSWIRGQVVLQILWNPHFSWNFEVFVKSLLFHELVVTDLYMRGPLVKDSKGAKVCLVVQHGGIGCF